MLIFYYENTLRTDLWAMRTDLWLYRRFCIQIMYIGASQNSYPMRHRTLSGHTVRRLTAFLCLSILNFPSNFSQAPVNFV